MKNSSECISMIHGSGGLATSQLIESIFAESFDNDTLNAMEDSAVVPGAESIAVTTDSFVVTPLQFPGGDIGRLSVCGTVNDLLMRGAVPKYLTCGYILEEGLSIEQLKEIVISMAKTAKEAGVQIVAGDTKVVEGNGGLYINTAGVGFVPAGRDVSAKNACPGDVIIVSGTMGEHHAAILGERMGIASDIRSDCAPLNDMVERLFTEGINVHCLRDITRGGLATVLKEIAVASRMQFDLEANRIPVTPSVKDFCGLLGLDPLYMGNEGKMVLIVPENEQERALDTIRNSVYGENAAVIGRVTDKEPGEVVAITSIGGKRRLDVLQDEGLPRIC